MTDAIASPPGTSLRGHRDHFENGAAAAARTSTRTEFQRWLRLADEPTATSLAQLAAGMGAVRPPSSPPEGGSRRGARSSDGARAAARRDRRVTGRRSPARRGGDRLARALGRRALRARARSRPTTRRSTSRATSCRRAATGTTPSRPAGGWRRPHRQVREMRDGDRARGGRVLDIGCGYGYFRVALRRRASSRTGLEVSAFAAPGRGESYGHRDLRRRARRPLASPGRERYDAVTGLRPDRASGGRRRVPAPGPPHACATAASSGSTPNLDCPEADVFGPQLPLAQARAPPSCFTPDSLTAAAGEPASSRPTSRRSRTCSAASSATTRSRQWERDGRGADIVAWYRKRG